MTRITLTLNVQRGEDWLSALMAAANDMEPAYIKMGGYMTPVTKQRFVDGQAPDGSKWAPNSPLTLSRKKGTKPGIGETGSLSEQIHWEADEGGVEIGSTMEYMTTFHFGALMGAFGRYYQLSRRTRYAEGDFRREAGSKKGHPIPWANIPARPVFGASKDDEAELLAILADHFQTALE